MLIQHRSRESKVKCVGRKPSCQRCLRVKHKCEWPKTADDEDEEEGIKNPESLEDILNVEQRRALTKIFFDIHDLKIMRQSIHRLTLETMEINQETTFLWFSIYCLGALYIPEALVRETFNGEPALSVSQRLALVTQRYSRDTSDKPSGMSRVPQKRHQVDSV
jgi:hypothetical protein